MRKIWPLCGDHKCIVLAALHGGFLDRYSNVSSFIVEFA